MNRFFIGIRYAGDDYHYFISAKNPIHALALIKRDWFSSIDDASSIEIKEVGSYETE